MLKKIIEPNEFGGETWLIEIGPGLNIRIKETNNSFVIDFREKGFFKSKTFTSFNSTVGFKETVKFSFEKLFQELQNNNKYHWTRSQKEKKLQDVLDLYESMVGESYENVNSFDTGSQQYWMLEAFKALEKNENESARVFAEKALELDNQNIDALFLFLTTLIKKIEDPSIHKLETNREKSRNIMNVLREKRKSGEFTERQETKFKEMSKLQFEFVEYVEGEVWKFNSSFDY